MDIYSLCVRDETLACGADCRNILHLSELLDRPGFSCGIPACLL